MTLLHDRPNLRLATPTAYVVASAEMQLSQRAEWLKLRQRGIGASDIPAICGLDQYTSPLGVYLEKRGEFERPHTEKLDVSARFGIYVEPFIANEFTDATGFDVLDCPGTLANVDRPWMLASPDRLLANPHGAGRGPFGVLEMKSRSAYQADKWKGGVPPGPALQTQWQLAVTGYECGYVAALIGNGPFLWFRIDRDETLIANLVKIGEEFLGWVRGGTQPPPDASQALADLLNIRWGHETDPDPIIASPIAVERWLEQREQAKAAIKAAEALVVEAENHLKTIAGKHEVVQVLGETAFTWKWRKHTDIDRKALREDGLYEQYSTTGKYRQFDVPKGIQ